MKVKRESAVVCDGCNTRDSFIYFAGPGGSRRVCTVCSNQQTGIDIVVNLHQSDDPPEMEVCNRCGYVKYLQDKQCTFCASVDGNPPENECECCMSTIGQGWELNGHGGKVCAACVAFLDFAVRTL